MLPLLSSGRLGRESRCGLFFPPVFPLIDRAYFSNETLPCYTASLWRTNKFRHCKNSTLNQMSVERKNAVESTIRYSDSRLCSQSH
mmetsp:Transcript_22977/g.34850  ORF Transcript_22977/g.34850 Transcript_22977/m.34850 type:complete len:86 (-) Transcript_22977:100-357(-)